MQSSQQGINEDVDRVTTAADLGIEIKQVSCNRSNSNLTVYVQNTGSCSFSNISLTVYGRQKQLKQLAESGLESVICAF